VTQRAYSPSYFGYKFKVLKSHDFFYENNCITYVTIYRNLLKLTELLLLTQKWRYTLLSEYMYFWAISPVLSDRVPYRFVNLPNCIRSLLKLIGWNINNKKYFKIDCTKLHAYFQINLGEAYKFFIKVYTGIKLITHAVCFSSWYTIAINVII